jgi:hypothetical protein
VLLWLLRGRSLTNLSRSAHGRYLIPTQHVETTLDASPEIVTRQRRVFFNPQEQPSSAERIIRGEDITLTADELKSVKAGDEWIYYKTWEIKDEFLEDKRGKGVDVVYVHGKPLLHSFRSKCRDSDLSSQATENTGKYYFP